MAPSDAELQTLTRDLRVAEGTATEGEVDWFSSKRGYGFITPDDGGDAVFVRHSGIEHDGFKQLQAGQRVRYVPTSDARGPRATHVRLVEPA